MNLDHNHYNFDAKWLICSTLNYGAKTRQSYSYAWYRPRTSVHRSRFLTSHLIAVLRAQLNKITNDIFFIETALRYSQVFAVHSCRNSTDFGAGASLLSVRAEYFRRLFKPRVGALVGTICYFSLNFDSYCWSSLDTMSTLQILSSYHINSTKSQNRNSNTKIQRNTF